MLAFSLQPATPTASVAAALTRCVAGTNRREATRCGRHQCRTRSRAACRSPMRAVCFSQRLTDHILLDRGDKRRHDTISYLRQTGAHRHITRTFDLGEPVNASPTQETNAASSPSPDPLRLRDAWADPSPFNSRDFVSAPIKRSPGATANGAETFCSRGSPPVQSSVHIDPRPNAKVRCLARKSNRFPGTPDVLALRP
jgi:hypothetical protein